MCCMYCCVLCCDPGRARFLQHHGCFLRCFCTGAATAATRHPPLGQRPGDTHRKHQKYQNMDISGVLFKYMTTILKNLLKLKL